MIIDKMILQVLFPENFCLDITVCDLWIKVAIVEFGEGEVNIEARRQGLTCL